MKGGWFVAKHELLPPMDKQEIIAFFIYMFGFPNSVWLSPWTGTTSIRVYPEGLKIWFLGWGGIIHGKPTHEKISFHIRIQNLIITWGRKRRERVLCEILIITDTSNIDTGTPGLYPLGDWSHMYSDTWKEIPDSWRRSENDVVVREVGTFSRLIYVVAPIKCVHKGNTFPYMLVQDLNHGISFLYMSVYVSLGILLRWGLCDIPTICRKNQKREILP